ncbi:hypothetical protein SLEP1_g43879 [Rubroshorea leprosula]|uniref:Uncharacterized protein n=1 Tax=Rubroshorea leprosula TaxID=152421 RepID=A0AAV5LFG3_9ROSI|nr:hypothetical protein SLEP1_g43879 [Rubroshorea leprosula]
MAADYGFTEDDLVIDEGLGHPKAYAKICRDRGFGPYNLGPPFTYAPYVLQQNEILRAEELEQFFPVIDPKAKPTTKPKIFVSLLWKQLNHLGNAGFDPTVIRVDPYGNVLYYHADKSSPLAWDIDHWFPCSRGGLTVPSNLRILQWQVCRRKHNKLDFQVPWWDLQLGISVNQFLSIFASSNSDFRHRAFSFLFAEGENEEINPSQTVESHSFPQHFVESKHQVGLAPAAIVVARREHFDSSSALKSLDYNRQIRPHSPAIAARKGRHSSLKENENPDFVTNPYQAIVMARDSLKQREESQKMQSEIQILDEEVNEMRRKNDEEKLTIQDLEVELTKRRRRAEKCRRLAEAQSSYRTTLEKMIRDAMHQSVIYKEQVRLNQAATNALMARLEAQKEICDASEKELHKKFKQRDELEKQIRPEWGHARKRSRMDDTLFEGRDSRNVLYLPGIKPRTPLHKELRVFLEEEQKASDAGLSLNEDPKHEEIEEQLLNPARGKLEEHDRMTGPLQHDNSIERKLQRLEIVEDSAPKIQFPVLQESDKEEDEESRRQRGKGNVERWLQMLLENVQEEMDPENIHAVETSGTDEIIKKLNEKYPQKEKQGVTQIVEEKQNVVREKRKDKIVEKEGGKTVGRNVTACEERKEKNGKERVLVRSESARTFRRIPSSPSLILGMKKGVDCIRKKPIVSSDDEDNDVGNSLLKSSIKTIKKAVRM